MHHHVPVPSLGCSKGLYELMLPSVWHSLAQWWDCSIIRNFLQPLWYTSILFWLLHCRGLIIWSHDGRELKKYKTISNMKNIKYSWTSKIQRAERLLLCYIHGLYMWVIYNLYKYIVFWRDQIMFSLLLFEEVFFTYYRQRTVMENIISEILMKNCF